MSRIFVTIAWSCEKWQAISWPMDGFHPPPGSFRVKKCKKKSLSKTRLRNRGPLKVLNDTKLALNEHEWPPLIIKDQFGLIWNLQASLELVSKELNHFWVIADLFRQIGGHSTRFVLFCSFWRLSTIKMIKSVKPLPFSFWKIITKNFCFYFIKFKPPA